MSAAAFKPDWLLKISAGVVPGLVLAVAIAGIFAWAPPQGISKIQLTMWLISPIWLTILSLVFLFHNGLKAWAWLLGADALAIGLYLLTRHYFG